eukprot:SAG31_NODE_225_length_19846_cov_19.057983_21_plen_66_part_00
MAALRISRGRAVCTVRIVRARARARGTPSSRFGSIVDLAMAARALFRLLKYRFLKYLGTSGWIYH